MSRHRPTSCFRPSLTALEDRANPASPFLAAGAGAGGTPLVEVTRPDGSALARFEAFETSFRGGVRAAAGEFDGNPNTVEVAAAAGPGGGPRVRVFSIDTFGGGVTTVADFFVFEPGFRDGVRVAAGRVGGGALDRIVVGTDPGGGPRVRTFDLFGGTPIPAGGPLSDFFAFEPSFRGGVRVAAGDVDGNPLNGDELIVAAGAGGGPRVRVLRADGSAFADYYAAAETATNGVNVGVVNGQVATDTLADDATQRNAALTAAALRAGLAATAQTTLSATAFPSLTPSLLVPGTGTGFNTAGLFGTGFPGSTGLVSSTPGLNTGPFDTRGFLPPIAPTTGAFGTGTGFGTTGAFNTTPTTTFGTGGVFGTGFGPLGTNFGSLGTTAGSAGTAFPGRTTF